jgi:hypothetical protein
MCPFIVVFSKKKWQHKYCSLQSNKEEKGSPVHKAFLMSCFGHQYLEEVSVMGAMSATSMIHPADMYESLLWHRQVQNITTRD